MLTKWEIKTKTTSSALTFNTGIYLKKFWKNEKLMRKT